MPPDFLKCLQRGDGSWREFRNLSKLKIHGKKLNLNANFSGLRDGRSLGSGGAGAGLGTSLVGSRRSGRREGGSVKMGGVRGLALRLLSHCFFPVWTAVKYGADVLRALTSTKK